MISCLVASALWAVSLSLFRGPIDGIGPRAANFFKCAFAVVVYAVVIAAFAHDGPWGTPADWIALGLSGLVGFTIGDSLLFVSVREGGVQRALVLFNTSPILTVLAAIAFLGEVPTGRAWAGLGLVLLGVLLVETDPRRATAPGSGPGPAADPGTGAGRRSAGQGRAWLGTLAGLGAAAGQAAGILLARGPLQTIPILPATTIRLSAAVLGLVPLMLAGGRRHGFGALPPRTWPRLALPTLLGTVVALLFAMRGVRDVPAGIAASLLATTPIFALPISRFALREPIGSRSIAGTMLAVAGVALLS